MKSIDDITNIFYINLEHRTDRKEHVEHQLSLLGLSGQRFNAIKMENGAIGCSMSHLKLLQNALTNKLEHILIVEDDITFLKPEIFKSQLNKFLASGRKWDVILFAGNNMGQYEHIDDTCIKVSRCQTTTGYLVNGHYFDKLINNFRNGINKLIQNPQLHILYAIDKYWFNLQKVDNWFLIIPLTVTQREDYSDIEKRPTNYTNVMTDLDKEEFFKQQQQHQQAIINMSSNKMTKLNITPEPIKSNIKLNAETNKPSMKINMKI
jgi:glycosyl transferase family 25